MASKTVKKKTNLVGAKKALPDNQDVLRKMHRRIKAMNSRIKALNGIVQGNGGMGGCNDFGVGNLPWTDAPLSITLQLRESEFLYQTDWQSYKIIEIPVDDMLRKPWEYEGINEQQSKILVRYQTKLDTMQVLREALRLERLFGGAAIFMGVSDFSDSPEQPLNINNVGLNGLRFLNTIPRNRITKVEFETDPLKFEYGRPRHYWIQDQKVHASRLMMFNGDPILRSGNLNLFGGTLNDNKGFGIPVLMRIYSDLIRATGSRQAAYDLIYRASILVFSGDVQSQMTMNAGVQSLGVLEETLSNINNYKAAMINNTPDSPSTLQNLSASFGSIPELLMSFLQVLSAASDIPASRFLGQAPGGLNATGESDLENYYNSINAKQTHRLRPQLSKLLVLLLKSTGLAVDVDDIDITFPPLWNASELEEAQVRQIDTQNISSLGTAGFISDEEALEELKLRGVLLTDPQDFPAPEREPLNDGDFDLGDSLSDLRSSDDDPTA